MRLSSAGCGLEGLLGGGGTVPVNIVAVMSPRSDRPAYDSSAPITHEPSTTAQPSELSHVSAMSVVGGWNTSAEAAMTNAKKFCANRTESPSSPSSSHHHIITSSHHLDWGGGQRGRVCLSVHGIRTW